MDEFRHLHAVRVIFVETPVAGSPKVARTAKPGQYPRNAPTHWQPRTKPPSRAERTARFLRNVVGQESAVREFMRSAREESSHAN
jgi:hypothetical protein